MSKNYYLGLDLSTQSLTAVVIEPASGDLQQYSTNFDISYPSYHTTDGVNIGDDPTEVTVNPRMWIEALDDMLSQLSKTGLTPHIQGISVSAQQHGSVYLNALAATALKRLEASKSLLAQLMHIFSRDASPIWMDSSTTQACTEISSTLGGNEEVARLTGSVATERFAGPQIRKFWRENPAGYEKTSHIALISSFITSLLIGRLCPVDAGDGYGMNLADILSGSWSPAAMNAAAPDLARRLPGLVIKDEIVGKVSPYLVSKYGFDPLTDVVVGSGDNPCSLVGLGLIGRPQTHAISLGTSDTCFGYTRQFANEKRSIGHIFGAADGHYMFLICFKNGSLAREQVKERYGLSWRDFSDILLNAPPGNRGRIMLPWFMPEITPIVLDPAVARFGGLKEDDAKANVVAVAEAQAMALYRYSEWAGQRPDRIIVTAGGSENRGLLRIIARVFGTAVESFEVKESAALGAAVRAASCCEKQSGNLTSWNELIAEFLNRGAVDVISATPEETEIYRHKDGLLHVHEVCEQYALGKGGQPGKAIRIFKQQFQV